MKTELDFLEDVITSRYDTREFDVPLSAVATIDCIRDANKAFKDYTAKLQLESTGQTKVVQFNDDKGWTKPMNLYKFTCKNDSIYIYGHNFDDAIDTLIHLVRYPKEWSKPEFVSCKEIDIDKNCINCKFNKDSSGYCVTCVDYNRFEKL